MKILIVEDDPMVSSINKRFALKVDHSFQVETCLSLEDAKDRLLTSNFDLLLLDVYFPKGLGIELLPWLREHNIDSEVILITADNSVPTIETSLKHGVTDFIIKPFNYERFNEAIHKVLHRRQLLASGKTVNQEQIDQIISDSYLRYHSSSRSEYEYYYEEEVMEKGLSLHTFKSIKSSVDAHEDFFTAESLSERIGLARVTVRRYIEYMVKEGLLEKQLSYGKVGRPQHLYRRKA